MEMKVLFVLVVCIFSVFGERNWKFILEDAELKSHSDFIKVHHCYVDVNDKGESYVSLKIESSDVFNQTFECHLDILEKKRGTWTKCLFSMKRVKCCDVLENDNLIAPDVRKQFNAYKCPVPKGIFELKKFTLNEERFPEFFPGNEWRISLSSYVGSSKEIMVSGSFTARIDRSNSYKLG